MFNQTRKENQDKMTGYQQMSLQEELSSTDYKVEMMDMLNISHDVSLNISYDGWTEQKDKFQATINHDYKELEHVNSEKMNEKTVPENAGVKKEVIENIQTIKLSKNATDDHSNAGCDNDAQSLMNRYHPDSTNIHLTNNYCEQKFSCEIFGLKPQIESSKCDSRPENIDIEQNTSNEEHTKNDAGMEDGNIKDSAGVDTFDLQQLEANSFDITYNDNFITNSCDKKLYNFESEDHQEHASISSGFSEEVGEATKVDQECQTDIAMPHKSILESHENNSESFQAIFSQMFALLKRENVSY